MGLDVSMSLGPLSTPLVIYEPHKSGYDSDYDLLYSDSLDRVLTNYTIWAELVIVVN